MPSRLERVVDRVPFLEKELFLLRRLIGHGDVCLDIGAAGGAHLLVMALRAGRRGRVVGVEPRPGSHRFLSGMVRLLGISERVELLAVALAEDEGEQQLRIPVVPTRAHLRGSATDADDHAAFSNLPHREIEVPTTTLDRLVASLELERVDVVKCDVEGAELAVLAGARDVLDRLRPVVIIEADDEHQARFGARAQDVLDAVTRHGYRAHRYRRGALEPVNGVVDGEDDYVLVPHGRTPRVRLRTGT